MVKLRSALATLLALGSASLAIGAACGSFGSSDEPDVQVPDGAARDAHDAPDPPRTEDASGTRACNLEKPFGPPIRVPGLDTADDETNASFSVDELTVYLARQPIGSSEQRDIYVAERAGPSDPFGVAVPLVEVSSARVDDNASVSANGLVLVLHSTRDGGSDLYVATREAGAPFSVPAPIVALNTDGGDLDPFVSPDAKLLYYARSTGPGAVYDIVVAAGDGAGRFDNPVVLGELREVRDGAASHDSQPVVRADGLEIFFASNRSSPGSTFDIWRATRTTAAGLFGAPTLVAELNTPAYEAPTWVSPDGCRLYFKSDRPGSGGGQDIWMASRGE